ncbi:VOC family protein [Pigmentiphaga sp. YJ18]|uniref:VOC family protein n=1 Tax=Pigmentiphaga sp. YJ18 TaxID=3134907 RepID=UPI003112D2C6
MKPAAPSPAPMRGIDHLAFVTDDLPSTMDFYTRVMQMRLVHVRRVPFEQDRGQPPYDNLRHYFFDMGHDQLLAFFEYPAGLARQDRDLPGGMQHVAFHVEPERFDALLAHVRAAGIEVIGPVALGGRFWSAYFYDPNGIRLEFATSRGPRQAGVVESVLQSEDEARAELSTLFADPEQVVFWLGQMPLRDHADAHQG